MAAQYSLVEALTLFGGTDTRGIKRPG